MGKRQVRLDAEQLSEKNSLVLNQEVNVILKNDVTLHGRIVKFKGTALLFRDLRAKKHWILLSHISEVIYDHRSDY